MNGKKRNERVLEWVLNCDCVFCWDYYELCLKSERRHTYRYCMHYCFIRMLTWEKNACSMYMLISWRTEVYIYIYIYISSSKKLTSSTSFTTVPHLNCPTFFFYCCWSFDIFIQMYASTFCFCAECLHLSQFIGYHDYAAKYSAVVKFVGFRLAFIQCFRKNQTDQFEAASSARYIRLFVEEPSFWTYWSLGLTAQISLYQPTVLQLPVECSAVPYRHPNRLLLLPIIKWIMARDPS